jgi:surfactin synthase thioesterase subunit
VSGPWFTCYQRLARPAARLVCFPYAGGGAAVFRPWVEPLAPAVELWAAELPGRARRIAEPALGDLSVLAAAAADAVRTEIEPPFVLFGHSMGGLAAYEVCRRLRGAGAALPRHLVVSARRAPQLPSRREPIARLPDAEFVQAMVERYDGIPAAVRREPELLALFLPMLRADLGALETYRYEPGPPLPLPLTALAGSEDSAVPATDIAPWREHTAGPFALHTVEGGHFFLNTNRSAVLALLRPVLAGGDG